MKDNKIEIRIPSKLKDDFNEICEEKGLNKSLVVRLLIDDFVKGGRNVGSVVYEGKE